MSIAAVKQDAPTISFSAEATSSTVSVATSTLSVQTGPSVGMRSRSVSPITVSIGTTFSESSSSEETTPVLDFESQFTIAQSCKSVNFKDAYAAYEKALTCATNADDRTRAINGQACLLEGQGFFSDAIKKYRSAIDLNCPNIMFRMILYWNFSKCLSKTNLVGYLPEIIDVLRQAAKFLEACAQKEERWICAVHHDLAKHLMIRNLEGDYKYAKEHCMRALSCEKMDPWRKADLANRLHCIVTRELNPQLPPYDYITVRQQSLICTASCCSIPDARPITSERKTS